MNHNNLNLSLRGDEKRDKKTNKEMKKLNNDIELE